MTCSNTEPGSLLMISVNGQLKGYLFQPLQQTLNNVLHKFTYISTIYYITILNCDVEDEDTISSLLLSVVLQNFLRTLGWAGEGGIIIFCFTAMLFNIIAVTDFINAISSDSVKFPGSKYIINIILCQLYGP